MRRRSVLALAAAALIARWWRSRSGGRVELLYEDGSFVRLDRGVETDDLLRDAREILGAVAP